ncbi:MAG TPA: PqiC family protein [Burkholderiaceae bacterium]|nr:PqiC family protein [Burkholderiaceae bacterium]
MASQRANPSLHMRLLTSRCLLPALLIGLAGCATSEPPTVFHTLLPEANATVPAASPAPVAFRLARVSVPSQVDHSQWVVRTGDGVMTVLEHQRWVARLADEWHDALSDRLGRRLGAIDIGRGSSGPRVAGEPALPVFEVQAELHRFDSVFASGALEQAVWSVRAPGGNAPAVVCSSTMSESASPSYASLAAAHRAIVMRLADAIAEVVQALREGRSAACPAS